jgi:hypothetical protein
MPPDEAPRACNENPHAAQPARRRIAVLPAIESGVYWLFASQVWRTPSLLCWTLVWRGGKRVGQRNQPAAHDRTWG